jgi:hypothetical protein
MTFPSFPVSSDEIPRSIPVQGQSYRDFLFTHGRCKVSFKSSHGSNDDPGACGGLGIVRIRLRSVPAIHCLCNGTVDGATGASEDANWFEGAWDTGVVKAPADSSPVRVAYLRSNLNAALESLLTSLIRSLRFNCLFDSFTCEARGLRA